MPPPLPNPKYATGKGKGQNTALKERTPHRATERHLSYGITQCYLPPDGVNAPHLPEGQKLEKNLIDNNTCQVQQKKFVELWSTNKKSYSHGC